jgi:hypothetical protein
MPVGRVNERSPLGHSGHRKLQEVVGSIEILTGIPRWFTVPDNLDLRKLEYTRAALSNREASCLPTKLKPSVSLELIHSKLLFQKRIVLSSGEYFMIRCDLLDNPE